MRPYNRDSERNKNTFEQKYLDNFYMRGSW